LDHVASPPPYKLSLGSLALTIVSDGTLQLGDPKVSFNGVAGNEIDTRLRRHFLPTDSLEVEQNVVVIETGDRTIVFDPGMGSSTLFGPHGGKLKASLAGAGIALESVNAVVVSHPHPDHIGGICDSSQRPLFPNAEIYLSEADFEFWTNENLLGTRADTAVQIARANLLPVRDRMVFFKDGQEFLPGIQAIVTPGHTKEHAIFMVTSNSDNLCLIGDLSHHHVLLLEQPQVQFAYDLDPHQAAESRVGALSMLASNRIRMLGYHFPWPGIGHVGEERDGFRYFPEPLRFTSRHEGSGHG